MALTLYDTLYDSLNNQYNFIPAPDYQNIWINTSQYDGQYYAPAGSWQDDAGSSTSPFTETADANTDGYSGDIIFNYGNNTVKLTFIALNSLYSVDVYLNNTRLGGIIRKGANMPEGKVNCWFVKDENGIVGFQGKYVGNRYGYIYKCYCGLIFSQANSELIDDVLSHAQPVLYNWVSVPSVSGKNGILNLSTLNDVNDGEPVETSDTSKFNLTDGSNVSALVTARLSE